MKYASTWVTIYQEATVLERKKFWNILQEIKELNEERCAGQIINSYQISIISSSKRAKVLKDFRDAFEDLWKELQESRKKNRLPQLPTNYEQIAARKLIHLRIGNQAAIDLFDLPAIPSATALTFVMSKEKFEILYQRLFSEFVSKDEVELLDFHFLEMKKFLTILNDRGRFVVTRQHASQYNALVAEVKKSIQNVGVLELEKRFMNSFPSLWDIFNKESQYTKRWRKIKDSLDSYQARIKIALSQFTDESTGYAEIKERLEAETAPRFPKNVKPRKKCYPYNIPPNIKYSDIEFRFLNGQIIQAQSGRKFIFSRRVEIRIPKCKSCPDFAVDFDDMNFGNEIKGKIAPTPNISWLVLLALMNGETTLPLPGNKKKILSNQQLNITKEKMLALKNILVGYFGIDDDPKYHFNEFNAHKLKIKLTKPPLPDSDE